MGMEVTIYGSPMSEITIYGSPMSESGKGMEVRNWKVLEGSRTGHVSRSLEVEGTESGDGVGGSLEVREDLGMACNTYPFQA